MLALLVPIAITSFAQAEEERVVVRPVEDTEVVLHNPDMGWVLYENYPLDQQRNGAGTLSSLPSEDFPEADAVALMFAWSDIEKAAGEYDFTHVDHAYDYWAKRGKDIQLRMSTESLLWWNHASPPAGLGVPDYVLAKLPERSKHTRSLEGIPYVVVDVREPYYLERLDAFLEAVNGHFDNKSRPVTMIDLRGFGVWGEWHSGFAYPTTDDRREALTTVIDHWTRALPEHWVSLSYSYDPDGPKRLYEGPYQAYEGAFTRAYDEFLAYSAFDHALTKSNIAFRRDGAGGAVHSNERKLCEAAFASMKYGPFMSEFCGGYVGTKPGGERWQRFMIDDALSLHPNYVNLLGWQAGDALAFCKEKPEWVKHGLRTMGYRLVPLEVYYPRSLRAGEEITLASEWTNRGVGRALRAYELRLVLINEAGAEVANVSAGTMATDQWIKGNNYCASNSARIPTTLSAGRYTLGIRLVDPRSQRPITLPVVDAREDRAIWLADIEIDAQR